MSRGYSLLLCLSWIFCLERHFAWSFTFSQSKLLPNQLNLSRNRNQYSRNSLSSLNHAKLRSSRLVAASMSSNTLSETTSRMNLDSSIWNSIIDDVYLITTNQSKDSKRLELTKDQLEKVQLWNKVNVRTFKTDDEDRVRGCYTSHIAVLKEIREKFKNQNNYQVLVLEDNLELTAQGDKMFNEIMERVSLFLRAKKSQGSQAPDWDIFHLAYMMYVPGLSMKIMTKDSDYQDEPWASNIVKMYASVGASVGTSSYIVSKSGVDRILAYHEKNGYIEAIPNVMAELFPESRYAAFPMIFHRAGKIGSLVNPQLDDFRKIMFNPLMYTNWERLMVSTGLQNNQIFPTLLISLFILLASAMVNVFVAVTSSGDEANASSLATFAPLLPLLVFPLFVGLWGASLFKSGGTGAGFTASANAAAAAKKAA